MLWVWQRIPTQVARTRLSHDWTQRGQANRPAFGNLVEQREDAPGDFRQQVAHRRCDLLGCYGGRRVLAFAACGRRSTQRILKPL
jgi:hypothetical protein